MSMNEDSRKKAEQICRMLWQGYGRAQTARMMGMSYEGLLRITKTEEYREIDEIIRQQVLGGMDATLARRTDIRNVRDELRDEMEDAVPEAWRVLIQNLRHKQNLKAALEVLDRDPERQFSKTGAGLRPVQNTNIGVGVQVQIDSQALAQAIQEADRTHELINRAGKSKPAEA